MPQPQLEPSVWPDDLFTVERRSFLGKSRWWVLHTRPRAEKMLARHLAKLKVPFYLPLRKQPSRSRSRNRTKVLDQPVFPSYLFLLGDDDARLAALKTNQVVHTLAVNDQDLMTADLDRVQRLIEANLPLSTIDGKIPGTLVDIISGSLAGYQGTVVRHNGATKLLAEVNFFQRSVLAEIDESMIQPVWQG